MQNLSVIQGKTKITLKSQSHNLTFSLKMAYDFLKAFVETKILRRWEAKSEREVV